MKRYTTRSGAKQFMPSMKSCQRIIEGDNTSGYCLACGAKAHNVEPDARKYTCESCQAPKVFGAEELMLMGLVY